MSDEKKPFNSKEYMKGLKGTPYFHGKKKYLDQVVDAIQDNSILIGHELADELADFVRSKAGIGPKTAAASFDKVYEIRNSDISRLMDEFFESKGLHERGIIKDFITAVKGNLRKAWDEEFEPSMGERLDIEKDRMRKEGIPIPADKTPNPDPVEVIPEIKGPPKSPLNAFFDTMGATMRDIKPSDETPAAPEPAAQPARTEHPGVPREDEVDDEGNPAEMVVTRKPRPPAPAAPPAVPAPPAPAPAAPNEPYDPSKDPELMGLSLTGNHAGLEVEQDLAAGKEAGKDTPATERRKLKRPPGKGAHAPAPAAPEPPKPMSAKSLGDRNKGEDLE